MIFSSRVFSGITLLAGSGVFWIVQDGCGFYTTCSPVTTAYGKTCDTMGTCKDQGSINNFEEVCSKECIYSDRSFYEYNDCSSCTISTVYGTICEKDTTIDSGPVFYTCSTLYAEHPGGDVFTCRQKVCGSLFDKIYDCTTRKTVPAT